MRLKPKKGLGQNFLVDKNIQHKIITACGLSSKDTVLEIGSGRGELTRLAAPLVKHVFAVEVDKALCPALAEIANTTVINQDILKTDLRRYLANVKRKVKVIGNIPYYISSPIIEHLFKFRKRISSIYLTVQKEFGERLAASPGSKVYGSLSCFVLYYAEPRALFSISRNSFFPAPKVDSALVRLKIRKKTALSGEKEKRLFKIIRAAFNQRRKTLRNSLKGIVSSGRLKEYFLKEGIDENIRPECLSLGQFIKIEKYCN